jgi:hypothetical protein
MDENMREIYNAYCAVEFKAAKIWIEEDFDYMYLSHLQKYYKFVRDEIDPEWNNTVRNILDDKTIFQLYNTPPMYFHKFPKFDDDRSSNDSVETFTSFSDSSESIESSDE